MQKSIKNMGVNMRKEYQIVGKKINPTVATVALSKQQDKELENPQPSPIDDIPFMERKETKKLLKKIAFFKKQIKTRPHWEYKYNRLNKKYKIPLDEFIKQNKDTLPKNDHGLIVYRFYHFVLKCEHYLKTCEDAFKKQFTLHLKRKAD